MNRFILSLCLIFSTFSFAVSANFQPKSKQSILIDLSTDTVLFEKDADVQAPPSSMSKMMTAYVVFDKIDKDEISPDTTFVVSKKAWAKGGSKTFLEHGARVSVDTLLKGTIVQSGNDAAITLAEGISGDEAAFSETCDDMAKKIGATHSQFINATGWPDEGHLSTARDLAAIGKATLRDFPALYQRYYPLQSFTHSNIKQDNRNALLFVKDIGCDGLKTGHTSAGDYGVVASAIQDGRRLLLVVNGLKSPKERAQESESLMRYGFSYFASPLLLKAQKVIEEVPVWLGAKNHISIGVDKDLRITLPRKYLKSLKVTLSFLTPLPAPIQKGDVVGDVSVVHPLTKEEIRRPLIALQSADKSGIIGRIRQGFSHLIYGQSISTAPRAS